MMKKRKFFALLIVSLTLITMGVSVFAQQPNINSPAVDYLGYWQNSPQNTGVYTYWGEMACPECGASGFALKLEGGENKPLNDGDIIAVITTAEATRNESQYDIGYLTSIYEEHTTTDHINGHLFYWQLGGKDVIFTVTPKPMTQAYFSWLVCPITAKGYAETYSMVQDYVVGNINNYIRGYASAFVVQSLYSGLLIEELTINIPQTMYDNGYQDGYADGQINATENMEAIGYIEAVIDGVAQPIINTLRDVSVMGISLLNLIYLFVTLIVVLSIVKVVRG